MVSLISFIVYEVDKSASQKEARRISENTLHFLAIVGGWPGALIAQERLRHKSQSNLLEQKVLREHSTYGKDFVRLTLTPSLYKFLT